MPTSLEPWNAELMFRGKKDTVHYLAGLLGYPASIQKLRLRPC